MKNNTQYRALVLDVDGTLVKYKEGSLPTEKVTAAIKKAQSLIPIILATGREYPLLKPVADHLGLTGIAICLGGAQIIDLKTNKLLWEKTIPDEELIKLTSYFSEREIPIYKLTNKEVTVSEIQKQKIYNLFTGPLPLEKSKEIRREFADDPVLSCHIISYWSDEKFSVHFTNTQATKQHGIVFAAEKLSINPQDLIGVGDGYNDFPLLMGCGFKVAMGNANDELKEIADYVAPSVDDDGVADVIEKFILPTSKKH